MEPATAYPVGIALAATWDPPLAEQEGRHLGRDEIVQIYVGHSSAKVSRPVKELKAFARVSLAPGETRHVALHLDQRSLSYYDTASHGWAVDLGKFIIFSGDSSVNVPLRKTIILRSQANASVPKQNSFTSTVR